MFQSLSRENAGCYFTDGVELKEGMEIVSIAQSRKRRLLRNYHSARIDAPRGFNRSVAKTPVATATAEQFNSPDLTGFNRSVAKTPVATPHAGGRW